MAVDPAASMRIWAVEVDLAGQTFDIPALPAADWLPALMEGELVDVVDLIEGSEKVDELIVSGDVSPAELAAALGAAVEQAAGRPVHQVTTLATMARLQWTAIGGDLARRGFRWDQVSIGAALDAIHVTVLAYLPKESAEKFQAILESEPVAGGRVRRPSRAAALAAFEEMAGPRPEPVKATGARSAGGRPKTRRRPPQPHQDGP